MKIAFACLALTVCSAAFASPENVSLQNNAQRDDTFISNMLYENREKFALLYFVQPGCVYCQHQLPVMEQFQKETDWYIKTIDIIQNPEVRSKFNINGTPVIVLIKKNAGASNWQAVSIGYSPLNTLRSDVYNLVRLFNGQGTQRNYSVRTQRNQSSPIK